VQKAGFVDYHGSFSLARGEQKTLPPVELVASVREVGFSIRSAPPGAEVWVDGRATDQLTPAKLTGVVPGIHRLQLKRPGYADYDLQMFVPEGTLLQLTADLVLANVTAQAHENRAPAVAHSEDDSNAASPASEPRATHAAHKPVQQHSFTAAAPAAAAYVAPHAQPQPRMQQQQAPAMQAAAPAPSAAGGRTGILRINSRPWAQIIVDGRLMGNTPQPNLQLSPGNHKVQLVNQPMGLSKSFSITVKAGEVVTKVMNLSE
jgi:hypothetical protein